MKRLSSVPRSPPSEKLTGSAFAALIGHELNNIAVPLHGFTELAMQSTAANAPARQSLDEMQIAIGRIRALASDLECLGESSALAARVAIGDCMPDAAGGSRPEAYTLDWRCPRATMIAVDRRHAQRAIRALASIATRLDARFASLPQLTASQQAHPRGHCAACGAALAGKDANVRVETYSAYALSREQICDPFGAPGRGARRLTLAVLVHCAHHAGGHVVLDERSGRLSVAFPES
jgi:hypothetical protein